MPQIPAPNVLVACGASGGHIFPALAVANEFWQQHKLETCFVLGGKEHFSEKIAERGHSIERLPAAPWSGRNPLKKLRTLVVLFQAYLRARKIIDEQRPAAVVGFGGYATVALVLAAHHKKVPVFLHEQNVIPGRANRLLIKWADKIAVSFAEIEKHLPKQYKDKIVLCGNPVSAEMLTARMAKREEDKTFHLLVQGGSLGASFISKFVVEALRQLSEGMLINLNIVHQARKEDVEHVKNDYKQLGIPKYEVRPFYNDMPRRLVWSHLTIGRSGAGTVAELALLGRASVLIPHRLADNHQLYNAKVLSDNGAAILMQEGSASPQKLAEKIEEIYRDRAAREQMESNAKKAAKPDAAENVANLVWESMPQTWRKAWQDQQ